MRRPAMITTARLSAMAACVCAPLFILGQQLTVGEQPDSGDAVFSTETRLVQCDGHGQERPTRDYASRERVSGV